MPFRHAKDKNPSQALPMTAIERDPETAHKMLQPRRPVHPDVADTGRHIQQKTLAPVRTSRNGDQRPPVGTTPRAVVRHKTSSIPTVTSSTTRLDGQKTGIASELRA